MKKILSLVCIFCLCFSMTFEISVIASENKNADYGAKLLSDLEIISEVQKFDESVTRAEFTVMLVKALGIGLISSGEELPFGDISSSDDCYLYVQTAYNLGIISSSDKFEPSRAISYEEMIKMTVCAIGYEFLAGEYGGWPYGFVTTASKLKMTDGINSSGANYGTAYALIYNTLTTPLPEVSLSNGNIEYSIHSGTSVLESVYKLTKAEGKIDGARYFGGVSGFGVGDGNTAIEGVVLKNGGFDTDSFFGCECIAYYDESGEIKTFYVFDAEKNSVVELRSQNEPEYSNLTYTYYSDDSSTLKKAKISPESLIVYNGKTAVYSDDIMLPSKGSVKLIKSGSGAYDIVIIEAHTEISVGGINKDKMFVTDSANPGLSVSFDSENYDSVSIYDQNGRQMSFGEIEPYDVVWFAKSSDGKVLKAIVSKNNFAGEFYGVSNSGIITIDGNKYTISEGRINSIDISLVSGALVMAYLNPDGEVVLVRATSSIADLKVAYLVASRVKEGMSGTVFVKLFTQDGYMKTYELAPRFKINGKSCKTEDYDNLPKSEYNPSSMKVGIVSYTLNRDNKIASINYDNITSTANGYSYTTLYQNSDISKAFNGENENDKYIRYYATQGELVSKGKSIFVRPETIQFRVPCEKDISNADEEDFSVRKFSEISSGEYMTGYNHVAYITTVGSLRSEYLLSTYELTESIGAVSTEGPLFIVKDISLGFDNDGDESTVLTLESNTLSDFKVYVKDTEFITKNNIGIGDLIKAEYDFDNKVSAMTIIYKCGDTVLSNISDMGDSGYTFETSAILTSNAGMAARASSYIVLGKVYARDNDIISILPNDYAIDGTVDSDNLKNYTLITISKILKFNTKTKMVSTVDYSNINDYLNMGSLADTVVYEKGNECLYIFE